jgi:hypothetical protein
MNVDNKESVPTVNELTKQLKHLQPQERVFYYLNIDMMKKHSIQKVDFPFSEEWRTIEKYIKKELSNELNVDDFSIIATEIQKFQNRIDSLSWKGFDIEKKHELESIHMGLWILMLNICVATENNETRDQILAFWDVSLQNENRHVASQIASLQIEHLQAVLQLHESLIKLINSSNCPAVLNNVSLLAVIRNNTQELNQIGNRIELIKSLPDTLNNASLIFVLNKSIQCSKDLSQLSREQLQSRMISLPTIKYYYQVENDENKLRLLSGGFAPSHELFKRYVTK